MTLSGGWPSAGSRVESDRTGGAEGARRGVALADLDAEFAVMGED